MGCIVGSCCLLVSERPRNYACVSQGQICPENVSCLSLSTQITHDQCLLPLSTSLRLLSQTMRLITIHTATLPLQCTWLLTLNKQHARGQFLQMAVIFKLTPLIAVYTVVVTKHIDQILWVFFFFFFWLLCFVLVFFFWFCFAFVLFCFVFWRKRKKTKCWFWVIICAWSG